MTGELHLVFFRIEKTSHKAQLDDGIGDNEGRRKAAGRSGGNRSRYRSVFTGTATLVRGNASKEIASPFSNLPIPSANFSLALCLTRATKPLQILVPGRTGFACAHVACTRFAVAAGHKMLRTEHCSRLSAPSTAPLSNSPGLDNTFVYSVNGHLDSGEVPAAGPIRVAARFPASVPEEIS